MEKYKKTSIVFVFTVMCVITCTANVRAEDARYTYYREITENTASDIGINVCYENVNQKEQEYVYSYGVRQFQMLEIKLVFI